MNIIHVSGRTVYCVAMEWPWDLVLWSIDVYRVNPILWDPTNSNYKDRLCPSCGPSYCFEHVRSCVHTILKLKLDGMFTIMWIVAHTNVGKTHNHTTVSSMFITARSIARNNVLVFSVIFYQFYFIFFTVYLNHMVLVVLLEVWMVGFRS